MDWHWRENLRVLPQNAFYWGHWDCINTMPPGMSSTRNPQESTSFNQQTDAHNRMMYLNYAALAPTHEEAEKEVEHTLHDFKKFLYSEAGIQWYLGKVKDCRRSVANLIGVDDPSTIAFTSNASTACHLLLSSFDWKPDDIVVTSSHENPSILQALRHLTLKGVQIHSIAPQTLGEFLGQVDLALQAERVKALVLSHVSHVDGRIFPVDEISALAREQNIPLVIDGAQAVGHIPLDMNRLRCSAYFFTGHKWCEGPLGTGAIIMTNEFLALNPGLATLAKELGKIPATLFEIGTQNIGLIAGLAKACEIKHQDGLHTHILERVRTEAKARFEQVPGIRFVGWDGPHAPGILTIKGKPGTDHVKLGKALAEEKNIIVKVFADYPKGEAPALRLSWSRSVPPQFVLEGFDSVARYLTSSRRNEGVEENRHS